jgi:hypothetical protein
VVKNVGLDNAVEESAANEAKLTVDSSSGTTDVVPACSSVVRKGWVGVLEVGDSNYDELAKLVISQTFT